MRRKRTRVTVPHARFDVNRIRNLPPLRLGDSHPDLSEVKAYLKNFGYLTDIDSLTTASLDGAARGALIRFQEQMGLERTGDVDSQTREVMSSPRCGLPDVLDELGALAVGPWPRRELTFAYGHLTTQISGGQVKAAVGRAFATWGSAGAGLIFREVNLDGDPDMRVEWRPANDPDRSMVGTLVAHADFPPGFSIVVSAPPLPLHFDDEEHRWTVGVEIGKFDIETIALHEIGHCLGLVHSSLHGAVMYANVQPNVALRSLQVEDIQRVRTLYP
jgi:hypothetical protein